MMADMARKNIQNMTLTAKTSGYVSLQTNTFGANKHRLERHGIVGEVTRFNIAGASYRDGDFKTKLPAMTDVAKATVFVTDMDGYAAVNDAYAAFFEHHRPARSVVGVADRPDAKGPSQHAAAPSGGWPTG